MPNQTNPIFEADTAVGEELAAQKKQATEAAAIPYGMEKATSKEWRQRIKQDEEFRAAEWDRFKKDSMGNKKLAIKAFKKAYRGKR